MKTIRTLFQRLLALAALAVALCVGFNPIYALAAGSSTNSRTYSIMLAAAKKTTAKKTTKTTKKPKTTKTANTAKTTKTAAAAKNTATAKTAKESTTTAKIAVKKAATAAKKTTTKSTAKPATAATKPVTKPAVKSLSKVSTPKTSVVTAAKKTTTKKTAVKKPTASSTKPKTSTKKSSTTAKKSSQPGLSVSANANGASADVENIVQPAAPADIYQEGSAEIVSDPNNHSGNSFITELISGDNSGNLPDQDKISAAVKTFISSVESAIKELF
jgi:hypothetical protein